ncbi:hypothetical protein HON71_05000 [Candidatus Woesearchaeota archaeon]|jgi:hypothetical protein|nr:hypothetical protein [Candidatus Woesearchaeota archaeon]MBT5342297.1 hypothetical protein [Candidatus Woesearchaeota archaeon]
MTRVFGFEIRKELSEELIKQLIDDFFLNMQNGLSAILKRNWVSFGLGFIVVFSDESIPISIYRGYGGITKKDIIKEIFESEYQMPAGKTIKAIFGVIQCEQDRGEDNDLQRLYKFPWEAKQWYLITAGDYRLADFSSLLWFDKENQWGSLIKYLNTNPKKVNFNWINKEVAPIIVAVRKDSSQILVIDQFSENNNDGKKFKIEDKRTHINYLGVRNSEDQLV